MRDGLAGASAQWTMPANGRLNCWLADKLYFNMHMCKVQTFTLILYPTFTLETLYVCGWLEIMARDLIIHQL